MFLSDYHTHSSFSSDGVNTMAEMAEAAIRHGMKTICFTDHADDCMAEADLSFTPDKYLEKAGIYEEYLKVRDAFSDKLPIRFGMELSGPNQNPQIAEKLVSLYPFDFIIGSAHNLTGGNDFYFMSYDNETECHELMDKYLDEHILMLKAGGFDVIGHIGYPLKYMAHYGIALDLAPHWDKLTEVLRLAIRLGVGIEINTSGLRSDLAATIPFPSVIKLYRELGGEIITTGSDGHNINDIGAGIKDAMGLLEATGFKYVTVFENRKPEFIKI